MLSKELTALLRKQVNMELGSAYIYLDMYSYYASENLDGFANWFYVQAQEETDHAMLFVKYLLSNGERVFFDEVAAPDLSYTSFRDPLAAALAHEQKVTASINSIYDAAHALKDFRTMQFLDWFVKEQGEEEENTDGLLKKYDLFGSDARSLYGLNAELAARVYAPPSLVL